MTIIGLYDYNKTIIQIILLHFNVDHIPRIILQCAESLYRYKPWHKIKIYIQKI